MAEKIIDVMHTTVDIPPKEQRSGYLVPFVKPTTGEPQGGNFSLEKLLDAEATQEELDAKADKSYVDEELKKKVDAITQAETDRLQNEEIGKKANASDMTLALDKKVDKSVYEVEITKKSDKTYVDEELKKKADKTASELLLMIADTPVFTTDAEGFPVPDGQRAKVHIDKRNLEGDVTIEGKGIAPNTLDFSVTPSDMAEDGIVLKNELADSFTDASNWYSDNINNKIIVSNGTLKVTMEAKSYGSISTNKTISINQGDKYYFAVTTDNIIIPDEINFRMYLSEEFNNISISDTVFNPKIGNNLKSSGVLIAKKTSRGGKIAFGTFNTAGTIEYKQPILVNITALSEKYPQYSDSELKAILDESLPYISAQQSKTLGGVCRLKNNIDNSTSVSTWKIRDEVTDFNVSGSNISGTLENNISTKSFYVITNYKGSEHNNDMFFCKIGNIISNNSYRIRLAYRDAQYNNINKNYLATRKAGNSSAVYVISGNESPSKVTIDTSKGICLANLTSSLLDLWLSLNGYSTDEAKADWCNEHIPPFEGTYDLVLGMKDSLTLKATCRQHTSSVLFKKAVTDIRKKYDIEESGENYIKYANGTAECWGKITIQTETSQWKAWGTQFIANISINQNYPLVFQEIPNVRATCNQDGYACAVGLTNSTAVSFFRVMLIKQLAENAPVGLSWHAIGRWK